MSESNVIIDYGIGNLGSVIAAFGRIGAEYKISANPSEIKKATRIVLPGVGNFEMAMKELNNGEMAEILYRKIQLEKVPTLGICLGYQILAKRSDESELPGLGVLDYEIVKIPHDHMHKLPHIGWNSVSRISPDALTENIDVGNALYFSHSYGIQSKDCPEEILGVEHGMGIVAALRSNNVVGAQFHPEKSGIAGENFLKNFSRLQC